MTSKFYYSWRHCCVLFGWLGGKIWIWLWFGIANPDVCFASKCAGNWNRMGAGQKIASYQRCCRCTDKEVAPDKPVKDISIIKKRTVWCVFYCYSAFIAPTGHIAAHVPHDTHFVGSIAHLPSSVMLIAPIGQTPAHVWQPMHCVLSILYAILFPFMFFN